MLTRSVGDGEGSAPTVDSEGVGVRRIGVGGEAELDRLVALHEPRMMSSDSRLIFYSGPGQA